MANKNIQDKTILSDELSPSKLKEVDDSLAPHNLGKNLPQTYDNNENKKPVFIYLQREVYKPSVSLLGLTLCMLVIISIIYLIYVLFIKLSLTGLYVDNKGNLFELYHDRASDNVRIIINNMESGDATLNGNILNYGNNKGLWDGSNRITFLNNGLKLVRIK